jgi:hypothetical protein
MARTLYHMTRTKFVGDGPRGSGLSRRSRVLLQAASLFWWVEEWACAVGNTFETSRSSRSGIGGHQPNIVVGDVPGSMAK